MTATNISTNKPSEAERVRRNWVDRLIGLPGITVAFLWGFAEGTLFFVVPDVVITIVAIVRPRSAWRHVVSSIAGAVLGGLVLFNWAMHDAPAAQQAVSRVPFVTPKMVSSAHSGFQEHGLAALFLGPLSGTPYKIYAVLAPAFVSRAAFLWATIPARGERFLAVWAVFAVLGLLLRRFRRRTDTQLVIWHGVLWIAFYSFYWGRIALR